MPFPKNKSEIIENSRNFMPKLLDFGFENKEIEK